TAPSPDEGSGAHHPAGLSAVSTNDVWVAGTYNTNTSSSRTLTLHWDGAQWSIVPSLNVNLGGNSLQAVAAVGANNVWVTSRDDQSWAFTEHFGDPCPQVTPTTTLTIAPTLTGTPSANTPT